MKKILVFITQYLARDSAQKHKLPKVKDKFGVYFIRVYKRGQELEDGLETDSVLLWETTQSGKQQHSAFVCTAGPWLMRFFKLGKLRMSQIRITEIQGCIYYRLECLVHTDFA